jgi:hypothetical protein
MLKLSALNKISFFKTEEKPAQPAGPSNGSTKPGSTREGLFSQGTNMRSRLQGMFIHKVDVSGKRKYEVAQGFMSESINAHVTFAKTTSEDNLKQLNSMLLDNDISGLQHAAEGNGMLRKTTTGLKSLRQMEEFAKRDNQPVTKAVQYFSKSAGNLLDTDIKEGVSFQSMGTSESYKEGPLTAGLSLQQPRILEHLHQIATLGKQLAQYEASPDTFKVPAEPMAAHTTKVKHVVASYANLAGITNAQRLAAEKAGIVSTSDAATLARLTNTGSTTSVNSTASSVHSRTTGSTATPLGSVNSFDSAETVPTPYSIAEEAEIAAFDRSLAGTRPQLKRSTKPEMRNTGSIPFSGMSSTIGPRSHSATSMGSDAMIRSPAAQTFGRTSSATQASHHVEDARLKRKPLPDLEALHSQAGPRRPPTSSISPNVIRGTNRMDVFRQARPLLKLIRHGDVSSRQNPIIYNRLEKLAENDPELFSHMQTLLGGESMEERDARRAYGIG